MKPDGLQLNGETEMLEDDGVQHFQHSDGETGPASPTASNSMMEIEERLQLMQGEINLLKQRNYEKDRGKEFESSYTRIFFLMAVTYVTLALYMYYVLKTSRPYLDAIVPTVGFNISTWGLPYVKEWWIQINYYWQHGEFEPRQWKDHQEFRQHRHEIMEAAAHVSGGVVSPMPSPTRSTTNPKPTQHSDDPAFDVEIHDVMDV